MQPVSTNVNALPQEPSLDEIRKLKRSVRLTLKANDNYLHSLVSTKRYNMIIKFIHSKLNRIALLLTWVIWFGLVMTQIEILWAVYIILIATFFWLPYCLCWLLSVNRTAFRNIRKSFDFWVKVIYMLVWGTFELIHRFILQEHRFQYKLLVAFAYLFFDLTCIMGLLLFHL